MMDAAPGPATRLTVIVESARTAHEIPMRKLTAWLEGGARVRPNKRSGAATTPCSPRATGTSTSRSAKPQTGSTRRVRVPTLSALTLDQWMNGFARLKKLNGEILWGASKYKQLTCRNGNAAANQAEADGSR